MEADGPIPGPHSTRNFGSAACLADKTLLRTFHADLRTLPGATSHPDTMKWWNNHRAVYEATRENTKPPARVMPKYVAWLKDLPGKPVFVAYPAAYDFMFVYWYLMRFAGESPFSHSALDMKTLAMAILGREYRKIGKRNIPRERFDPISHTHIALDDSIEQGELFCNILRVAEEMRKKQ